MPILVAVVLLLSTDSRTVTGANEEALDAFELLNAGFMVPMHHDTVPLGGEPMHEPEQRLRTATEARGLSDRVHFLMEGQSLIL